MDTHRTATASRGELSIVVQGALLASNVGETARNCVHWRSMLPDAQIVLAISTSDVLAQTAPGRVLIPEVSLPFRHVGMVAQAVATLFDVCDLVVLAEPALSLPRFKDDSGQNNFNYQLSAAKAGLRLATGKRVLRIRSDTVFLSTDFIDQYERDRQEARGPAATLEDRLLISSLFTLDPFSVERMPLHHSDWFHFGLTEDVRRLWEIPPMSLVDATYYRFEPHIGDSNARERQFFARLGVEQHLLIQSLGRSFPDLMLEWHNDRRSLRLAIDILVDNFCICDVTTSKFYFEKYASDIAFAGNRFSCVTQEDWRAMARAAPAARETVLRRKLAKTRQERPPEMPAAHYRAGQLQAGHALFPGERIVSPSMTTELHIRESGGLELVHRGDGGLSTVIWCTDAGAGLDRLELQADDGNLVLYGPEGRAVWATDQSVGPGASLEISDEGLLQVVDARGRVRWSSAAERTASEETREIAGLASGDSMQADGRMPSPNARFVLHFGPDARLALIEAATGKTAELVAARGQSEQLLMQLDGNLVAYARSGEALWATNTESHPGARLSIGDDGAVVITSGSEILHQLHAPEEQSTVRPAA